MNQTPRDTPGGVSLIIAARNRVDHLKRCVDAFFAVNTHSPVEVLIMDHDPSGRARVLVADYADRAFVRCIQREPNSSSAESLGYGAGLARYSRVCFVHEEAAFTADVLPAALARLDQHPGLHAVAAPPRGGLENLPRDLELNDALLSRYQAVVLEKASSREDPPGAAARFSGFHPDDCEPDRVNLVLYTCGDLDSLRKTWTSLLAWTDLSLNTLCVIDDSRNPRVEESISEWSEGLEFCERVSHAHRRGLCDALREHVAGVGFGDFCVLREGVVLTPGWLAGLKRAACHDRRIGLASPVTDANPLYAFRMNPGDNVATCARKLSLVSERHYPLLPWPDRSVFYLRNGTHRRHPLPAFCHGSEESYWLHYASTLVESDLCCVLADDVFVHAPQHLWSDPDMLMNEAAHSPGIAEIARTFRSFESPSLKHYADSDVRLESSKTVAVFFGGLNLGGGTLVLVELCNDLILQGWNVVAVLLNPPHDRTGHFDLLFEPYASTDPKEVSARLGEHSFLLATFWTTARMVQETALCNPTLVPFYFIQDFEPRFYDPRAYPERPREKEHHEQAGESYHLSLRHVTTSEWIAGQVRAFLGDPDYEPYRLRIGIKPELFHLQSPQRRPPHPVRIIAMARPRTPRRGFFDLIQTLSLVYEGNRDVDILLYGTDDLKAHDIPFSFRNLGVVPQGELRGHYNRAHIYVDTSLFQGFGLTGLEAMACGCACVLTESGGVSEYARHEENALLAPPGDCGAQARAIERLIEDQDLRRTLAANGVKTAGRFSLHHAAPDFERIAGGFISKREQEIEQKCAGLCTVIVPVFNALSATRICLESLAGTDHPHRVIIVDDRSDSHTASWLEAFAQGNEGFEYLRNHVNLGFVGSVNAGMRAAPDGDLVLLNSDTMVTPGWLGKLVRCAHSDPSIGVVSPLSTRSSHLWITPNPGETIFEAAERIQALSGSLYPDVVTPEGWCFYIKRRVYESLGGFDPIYGRGYCEESDYSMRALANGWRTVCCDDTLIFHEGMATFQGQRAPRYQENRKLFDNRWRYCYQQAYQGFLTRNPLGRLRRAHHALCPGGFEDPALVSPDRHRPVPERLAKIAPPKTLRRYRERLADPAWKAELAQRTGGVPERIVFVVQQMEPYGGVLSVIHLANDLIRLGLDVKVVVLTPRNHQVFPGLLTKPLYIEGDENLLERFPPADIVVATLWTTLYFTAALFARRPDFLPLYFVQDFEPDFYDAGRTDMRKTIEKTYTLAPYCFAKTPWLCQKIEAVGGRIARVPPALDLERFYPRDPDPSNKKVILTLLRPHTPQRGFEVALETLERLHSHREDLEIHSFGCTDEALEQAGVSLPLINHGVVPNSVLPELYSRAHVFLECSHFHGFGRTIAEAMACGRPCVITDSGGVSLFARHEENALIAPAEDVDGLAAAVNRLCDDQTLRRRLASRARPAVMQFDHLESARQTLSFFRDRLLELSPSQEPVQDHAAAHHGEKPGI